ncbi:Uncharacterised protein g10458 [Pycnogonum litorale]
MDKSSCIVCKQTENRGLKPFKSDSWETAKKAAARRRTSIKDGERRLRGAAANQAFVITGPEQAQRQSGTELLKNGAFKEEFACFLMDEWRRPQYERIIGDKTIFVSHGGRCIQMKIEDGLLRIDEPGHLQGRHEEADTLIAFHVNSVSSGNVLVRSTDTDVLIILIAIAGRSAAVRLILDYGTGNNRRYIDVTSIAASLEQKKVGLTSALLGLHALTGCDFTSCFFRKGKLKPFTRLEEDDDYVTALQSLSSNDVDVKGVTSFVCSIYGFQSADINDARYKAFIRMSGGNANQQLANLKKINCASLPPCEKTLVNHIRRAHYVAKIWIRADQACPTEGDNPIDFGWAETDGCFVPVWYNGTQVPDSLTTNEEIQEEVSSDGDESDNAWSDDSDEDSDGAD